MKRSFATIRSSTEAGKPDASKLIEQADAIIARDEIDDVENWRCRAGLMALGLWDKVAEVTEAVTAKKAAQNREKYVKKYDLEPTISDIDIVKIYDYEREKEITEIWCKGCSGEYCRKSYGLELERVLEIVDGRPEVKEIQCRKHRQWLVSQRTAKLNENSGLEPEEQGLMFTDFIVTKDNREAYELAKQAVEDGKTGMCIIGNNGVGKTRLALTIANESIRRGRRVQFWVVPSLFDQMRTAFDSKSGRTESWEVAEGVYESRTVSSYGEIMHRLRTAEVLILDDLGGERNSSWTVERLMDVINTRCRGKMQTIITTNLSGTELLSHLSRIGKASVDEQEAAKVSANRIMSRLSSLCKGVLMKGEDWRRKRK